MAYTREFLAITEALSKFRHYLLGHKLIIRTDQKSLKNLLNQSLTTLGQQAWLHKFIGYDFSIEYKPGKENLAADALSRILMIAWSEPQSLFLKELREELTTHAALGQIIQQCQNNNAPDPNYDVKDNLLYWKGRLVIPSPSSLIQKILVEYHYLVIGGHAAGMGGYSNGLYYWVALVLWLHRYYGGG